MRTSALFRRKNFAYFEIYSVSARTGLSQSGQEVGGGGGLIFRDFIRTSFMDGPLLVTSEEIYFVVRTLRFVCDNISAMILYIYNISTPDAVARRCALGKNTFNAISHLGAKQSTRCGSPANCWVSTNFLRAPISWKGSGSTTTTDVLKISSSQYS